MYKNDQGFSAAHLISHSVHSRIVSMLTRNSDLECWIKMVQLKEWRELWNLLASGGVLLLTLLALMSLSLRMLVPEKLAV